MCAMVQMDTVKMNYNLYSKVILGPTSDFSIYPSRIIQKINFIDFFFFLAIPLMTFQRINGCHMEDSGPGIEFELQL